MASGTENKAISLNKSLAIDGPILTAFVHCTYTLWESPEKSSIYLCAFDFVAIASWWVCLFLFILVGTLLQCVFFFFFFLSCVQVNRMQNGF